VEFRSISRVGSPVGPRVVAPDKEDAAVFQRALLAEVESVPRPGSFGQSGLHVPGILWPPAHWPPCGRGSSLATREVFDSHPHCFPNYRYKPGELPKPFNGRHMRSKVRSDSCWWSCCCEHPLESRVTPDFLLDDALCSAQEHQGSAG